MKSPGPTVVRSPVVQTIDMDTSLSVNVPDTKPLVPTGRGTGTVAGLSSPQKRRISDKAEQQVGMTAAGGPANRFKRPKIVLPTKFMPGGNINDPLNLGNPSTGATPKPSPIASPAPSPKDDPLNPIEILVPKNIKDPLNLSIEGEELMSPSGGHHQSKRARKRRRKGSFIRKSSEKPGRKRFGGGPGSGDKTKREQEGPFSDSELEPSRNTGSSFMDEGPVLIRSASVTANPLVSPQILEKFKQPDFFTSPEADQVRAALLLASSVGKADGKATESMSDSSAGLISPPKKRHRHYSHHHRRSSEGEFLSPTTKKEIGKSLEEKIIPPAVAPVPDDAGGKDQKDRTEMEQDTGETAEEVKGEPDETSEVEQTTESDKKKKKKQLFKYGNYNQYYGKRVPVDELDSRMKFFEKAWFEPTKPVKQQQTRLIYGLDRTFHPFPRLNVCIESISRMPTCVALIKVKKETYKYVAGKDCLDVGCNVGLMTINLAKEFNPASILGLDIDPHLVSVARKNLRRYLDKGRGRGARNLAKFPKSFPDLYGPLSAPPPAPNPIEEELPTTADRSQQQPGPSTAAESAYAEGDGNLPNPVCSKFPHNVTFVSGNYVLSSKELLSTVDASKFDVILMLSISKWIHLNWGDAGIKLVFQRAFHQLKPGGCLILEPQAFVSYYRRRRLSDFEGQFTAFGSLNRMLSRITVK